MAKEKTKPKYSVPGNTVWAFRFAAKEAWFCILNALGYPVFTVITRLMGVFIAPMILACLERGAPLRELVATIVIFCGIRLLSKAGYNLLGCITWPARSQSGNELWKKSVHKHMHTSYANMQDHETFTVLEKARNATNGKWWLFWNGVSVFATNVLGFVAYLFVMTRLSPLLIVVSVVLGALSLFINKKVTKWDEEHSTEQAQITNPMNYTQNTMRDISAAKDLRIYGVTAVMQDVYMRGLRLLQAFELRRNRYQIVLYFLDTLVALLRTGACYAYIIYMTITHGWSASEFLLYFGAITDFVNWIGGIMNGVQRLHEGSVAIGMIREGLELDEPFRFAEGERIPDSPEGGRTLTLENVSFRYPGTEKDVLRDINLTLHPGEKIAVIGLNGAGKTTLVRLMCGLLDPTRGRVLLDGQDIRAFNRDEYYRLFSAVFQEHSLFPGTVSENIAQSISDCDVERTVSCARRAGIGEYIESLPDGYNTHFGKAVYDDGIELSGGQQQRLLLARALYKDAPVLILDEPTAALDPIAEDEIYRSYNDLTAGRSAVYISHRLASTRFCDRIILIDDGVIAEQGTHGALMAADGKYAQFFQIQAKYYKEVEEDAETD